MVSAHADPPAPSGGGVQSSIEDTDGDTKVQVEKTADDDTLRVDFGGTVPFVDAMTAVYDDTNVLWQIAAPSSSAGAIPFWQFLDDADDPFFSCFVIGGEVPTRASCWPHNPDLTNPWDSIQIGLDSLVTGNDGYAIGRNSTNVGGAFTAGRGSRCTGADCVAVGDGAAGGTGDIALGDAVGACSIDMASGVCVGAGNNLDLAADNTDSSGVVVVFGEGLDITNSFKNLFAAGVWDRDVTTDITRSNQVLFGGDLQTDPFDQMTLGWGEFHTAPQAFTVHLTDALGTDNSGAAGDLALRGSSGTGTGLGGNTTIEHCPASGTGSSVNACVSAMEIDGETGVLLTKSVTADPCSAGLESAIFYNTTGDFWCGCDGTNDIKLSDGTACF